MAQSKLIYIGIKGSVLALNTANGAQVWATKLKADDFVNVALDGGNLFAATRGEMFCLDPQTGVIRWHNPLRGYGWGLVSMAGDGFGDTSLPLLAAKRRRDAEAASAAVCAAAA